MALNLVSGVPAGVLRVISDGFLAPIRSFSKGAPHHFPKAHASGMGTESLGVIGCIFAENGPLEGGIESSFWGTGWGAKGDFMRYSYLYPYIFESRTHTFFESTCPELYAQQSWEWSDAYSWRNDLWKVNFKRVCEKPAGVLHVLSENGGGPLRKCTRMGQKCTSNHHKDSGRLLTTPLKVNFSEIISPRICIWSFPTLLCVYLRACAFEKGMGSRFENVRV